MNEATSKRWHVETGAVYLEEFTRDARAEIVLMTLDRPATKAEARAEAKARGIPCLRLQPVGA